MRDPFSGPQGEGCPFNPIITTTVLCDVAAPDPASDYFIGFFYNGPERSYLVTAAHCIEGVREVYPRFRSVEDPRSLVSDVLVDLAVSEPEIHPEANLAAIPLDVEVPRYEEGIVYDGPWPDSHTRTASDGSVPVDDVYASAFTADNVPSGRRASGERVPFSGDDTSVICHDKVGCPTTPGEASGLPTEHTLPQIRSLTISTPYRFDFEDEPTFLSEGRSFAGSSGAPIVYMPPTKMYVEEIDAKRPLDAPRLAGVRGRPVEGERSEDGLHLYRSIRAEELLELVGEGDDQALTPDAPVED